MTNFTGDIESLRKEAERKFLGRLHIVGVGIMGDGLHRLVFLLERQTKRGQSEISSWARKMGVPFHIEVVGKIKPLTVPNVQENRS